MSHSNIIQLAVFLKLLCSVLGLDDGKINYELFCYEDKSCGPESDDWGGLCKTGQRQSPIDLPWYPYHRHTRRVNLEFNDQYCSDEFWIVDNGHTIQVTLEPEPTSLAEMYGYEHSDPYIFAQIHFHWGNDSNGSEHSIDNEFFPMEAHLVHYNSKYANFSEAVASGDPTGLAVIAVFVTEGFDWMDDESGFETIAANVPKLGSTPTRIMERIDLSTFLPENGENFYRYFGSLTTPACNEVVLWTVVKEPIYVSPSLLHKFRRIRKSSHRRIGGNVRPTQELGDRIVQYLAKK